MSLPSKVLPSKVLPSRALSLITEYSKPVTHANWRTKHLMTTFSIYVDFRKKKIWGQKNFWRHLYSIIIHNIEQTDWFIKYMYVLKCGGAFTYINNHKVSPLEIVELEELQKNILQYKKEREIYKKLR